MSDEKVGGHNADTGYEHEDLSPQGVFILHGRGCGPRGSDLFHPGWQCTAFSTTTTGPHQPAANPMAATTGVDPRTMNYKQILEQAQQGVSKAGA